MSAETLREAAALMRERACSGSLAAPWTADVRQDGRAWVRAANPPYDLSMHGFGDDAKHIASWHPAVALAVADWLDSCADHEELLPGSQGYAMTVARAYLGDAA